jgi:hypothetical protein
MIINDLKLLDYEISPTIATHRPPAEESTSKNITADFDYDLLKPHEDVFSELYYDVAKESKKEEKTEEVIPEEGIKILGKPTPPTAPNLQVIPGKAAIQGFIDLCVKEGININITSWDRPRNTSRSGSKSHHVTGSALDITPGSGETWETLSTKIQGSELIRDYMLKNNLGIIDETKASMQRRTGATGAHWHIGPDKLAIEGRNFIFDLKDKGIYNTKFKTKDVNEFVKVMTKVYADVLDEMHLPKSNLVNLVKQAALESNYGTEARGNGFNLGGIKNFTGDESRGTINPSDNTSYLNFKDLKDFARFHVKLLHEKYDAIAARDSTDFVNRLHGANPAGRNYSVNKSGYSRMFNNMATLERIFNSYNT